MTTEYIDPNYPPPGGKGNTKFIIYGYTPALALCILGVVTFFLTFVAQLIRTIMQRSWFTSPLFIASLMELLGYIFRTLSSQQDPYRLAWYVAQYFLIVTAPILITATMYICLTKVLKIMELCQVDRPMLLRILGPKVTLWIFITADVVTTIVQVVGAALIGVDASNGKDFNSANDIVLAGIVIQTFFFCLYLTLFTATLFTVRKYRERLPKAMVTFSPMLWLSSIAVLVRLVFRLAETGDGALGYLMTHEAFFGCLEYAPILIAVTILVIWQPGSALAASQDKNWPQSQESKECSLES